MRAIDLSAARRGGDRLTRRMARFMWLARAGRGGIFGGRSGEGRRANGRGHLSGDLEWSRAQRAERVNARLKIRATFTFVPPAPRRASSPHSAAAASKLTAIARRHCRDTLMKIHNNVRV